MEKIIIFHHINVGVPRHLLHTDSSLMKGTWHGLDSCESLLHGAAESVTPSQESSYSLDIVTLFMIDSPPNQIIEKKCNSYHQTVTLALVFMPSPCVVFSNRKIKVTATQCCFD